VVISESNGAGPTLTDGITNLNFGSADIPNLVTADHPLVIPVAGNVNSYGKCTRWKVTAWVDTNLIDNLKWFKSAGTNAANWIVRYASVSRAYAQPDRSDTGPGGIIDTVGAWPSTAGTAIAITGSIATPTIGYNGNNYAMQNVGIVSTVVAGLKGSHTITYRYDES
jgi:hypothetical protein